jgi:hypothetical protein
MKRLFLLLLIIASITIGCKYDDGPLISFRTPFGRLYGVWEVEHFEINNVDHTQEYRDNFNCDFHFRYYSYNRLTFDKDQNTVSSANVGFNENSRNIMYIELEGGIKYELFGNSYLSNWEIKKLTNKKLWMESTYNDYDNNKTYYIELKKVKDENN